MTTATPAEFDLPNRRRISLSPKPYGSQNLSALFNRPLKTPLPHRDPLCLPLYPLWECSALSLENGPPQHFYRRQNSNIIVTGNPLGGRFSVTR